MSTKWLILCALVALLSIGSETWAKPGDRRTILARPDPEQVQRLNARYYAQDDEDGDDILEHEEDLADDNEEDDDEEAEDAEDTEDAEEREEDLHEEKPKEQTLTNKQLSTKTETVPLKKEHREVQAEDNEDDLQNLDYDEDENEALAGGIDFPLNEGRNNRRGAGRRGGKGGRKGRGRRNRRRGNRRCGGRGKRGRGGQKRRTPSKRNGNKRKTSNKRKTANKRQGQKRKANNTNKNNNNKQTGAPSTKVA
ncbi:hypothetical protein KR067_010549 [Drosophila pandora]|nr:hypothetical protein KR067_010549 [Drosophila pandora]